MVDIRTVSMAFALALVACTNSSSPEKTAASASASPSVSASASTSTIASVAPSVSTIVDAGVVAPLPPPRTFTLVNNCKPPEIPAGDVYEKARAIEYSAPNGQSQKLDIAWPKQGGPHPLVIFVHGGGWGGGDRSLHVLDTLRLTGAGYTAATIDYRLAGLPENAFPAPLEDLRCAVRFLRAHAADYSIDPTRVAAIGASAGGHLVAMLDLATDIPGDGTCPLGDDPVTVNAVVDDYGPAVLYRRDRYPKSLQDSVTFLLGGYTEEKARLASPIAHVDSHDGPILVVHGSKDQIVTVEDARELNQALADAKVPHAYVELEGRAHGFPVIGDYEVIRPATCTVMQFLKDTIGP